MEREKNSHKNFNFHFSPAQVVALGFFIIIMIGAVLLSLPIASKSGKSIGFLNALFTAASSVCVTGLTVVDTYRHWSLFGHVVILFLIQIGGIGFMTIVAMILIVAKKKFSIKERILLKDSLNQHTTEGIIKLVIHVVTSTMLFEGIGALILALCFTKDFGFLKGLWLGIFHSISSFCNSGMEIMGPDGLMPYAGNAIVNFVILALVTIGGIGFTVWSDILTVISHKKENNLTVVQAMHHLTLHSKIVLSSTLFLIVFCFLFFLLSEYANPYTLGGMPFKEKLLAALFLSISSRTAGFSTISIPKTNYATKFMMIIIMFIGGSPAGTAGGVKTVTVSVILLTVLSVIKGHKAIHAFNRSISFSVLQRALAIFMISLAVLASVTMILTFTEMRPNTGYQFLDMFFEATAALSTAGLSLTITPGLSVYGKLLIILAMFMGRIGPISIVMALAKIQSSRDEHISYPEGRILIG